MKNSSEADLEAIKLLDHGLSQIILELRSLEGNEEGVIFGLSLTDCNELQASLRNPSTINPAQWESALLRIIGPGEQSSKKVDVSEIIQGLIRFKDDYQASNMPTRQH